MAAFTVEEFARLRTAYQRRRIVSTGAIPVYGPGDINPYLVQLPRPVTAAMGDWIRSGERKWHLFTGDLAWDPLWNDVRAGVACRGEVGAFERKVSREQPAEDVCKWCVRLQPAGWWRPEHDIRS